ncbi:MAG: DUF327 family protein [Spirochaetaceae bacterium]|jgi:uncharacterized protein YaaR (DUF327 family)|nr:DUF327 family protein [Spirochaetaceae bacterium]
MAKIEFLEPGFFTSAVYAGLKAETKKKQDAAVRKGQKPRFSGILEHINRNAEAASLAVEDMPPSEETINELLDAVHSTGDDLKRRPLPEEILRYKAAVRNFLQYVVKYGYTAEKQVSGTNLLKRKNFAIVQVVDQKLEQLAAGILAGQTVQLEILARLEEITGLLVDLMQ